MTQQPSRIVQENVDALIERERAGRIEHGDDMDRTDFPVEAWLAELISESLDSANYGRKLQHMLPKLVAAAKRLEGMGFAWADGSWQATCTCPSGDGSLRWPCPVHTAGVHGAVAKVGSDHFRSIVDWLGPIPPPNTLLYAAPVSAAPADNLHAHLLHMLGAKDHEDAGRIIGELHAATLRTPAAQEAVSWTVVGPDGKSSIGGWQDMKTHDFWQEAGVLREGHRYAYAYAAPVTAAPEASYFEYLDRYNHSLRRAIHAMMAKLVFLLDEDQFADIEAIALAAGVTPAAPGIDLASLVPSERKKPELMMATWHEVAGWNACVAEIRRRIDASPKGYDVPHRDLVPGVMRCAKCAFQLHRTNLYLGSGTTGPGDSKTEPCPNGCGPLWPVTWQTWATEGWQQAERYFEELRQLQDSPKGGSAACERIAAMLYQEATDEPWTVAGVEHDGPDRAYYRELARRVLDAALVSGEAHHG